MPGKTVYPEGHWSLPVDIPCGMGLQQGMLVEIEAIAMIEEA